MYVYIYFLGFKVLNKDFNEWEFKDIINRFIFFLRMLILFIFYGNDYKYFWELLDLVFCKVLRVKL